MAPNSPTDTAKAKAAGLVVVEVTPETVRKSPREPMLGDVVIDEWGDDA